MVDVFVIFRETCKALDKNGEAGLEELAKNLALLPYMRMRCKFNENTPEENIKRTREAIEMFSEDFEITKDGKVRHK